MAQKWADSNNVITYVKKADWAKHGKAAGPIRNTEMLRMLLAYKQFYEVLVVAFPGGRGTKNMVEQAQAANIIIVSES